MKNRRRMRDRNKAVEQLFLEEGVVKRVKTSARNYVSGQIVNTGHSVVFRADPAVPGVNISGGPLSYNYRFQEIHLHYGRTDGRGSEHTLAGRAFPAEVGDGTLKYRTRHYGKRC
ncbi:CA10 [Cordylochernes scorpioides]|uniref:CA10 n=1 Tax=Cordylochernes scorpioides TaxID=51811 RepID=A0ABY6L6G3_9ARAC|nr:CA10 [Cordylochernes scorpioides]